MRAHELMDTPAECERAGDELHAPGNWTECAACGYDAPADYETCPFCGRERTL